MEPASPNKSRYQVGRTQGVFLLTVLTLLYLLDFADRSVLSAVLEPMKIALGLTDTELGIVQSVFNIGVGLLSIPMSFVVDRWSRRKSLGLMAIIWSIATFATGMANKFVHLLFARALVGIGESGYVIGGVGWLSVAFPKNRKGLITGIFGIGAVLGTVLGLILAGFITTKTGSWQTPFFFFAVPGVILGIAVFFFKDYAVTARKSEGMFTKKYFIEWIQLFKIKSFTYTTIAQTFFGFFYFTYIGFLPALLMRAYNLDAAKATLIVGLTALLAIVGAPLGGWLADLWLVRNRAARPLFMSILQLTFFLSAGATFLLLGNPLPLLIVFMVITSLSVSVIGPMLQSIITDICPLSHRVSGNGLLSTFIYFAGAALGPWVVGLISDAYGGEAAGLKNGFLFILPALLIASILYFISCRDYVEDSARVNDEAFAE